jgi:alkylation response protein AidB-like acyl-CoA dehydrogenase
VRPRNAELEKKDWKLARELVRKGAELGFIGATVVEEYGGLGLDQVSSCILGEALGRAASFATTMGAQGGIGLLPIVYYGTEEAKQKYIPRVVSGELITAYALTEAGSGSDALAAKATAKLSEDGTHYVIKGEKMWITNGGFADLFVVFAKVDGDKFTGFIVERQEGLSNGAEEHKMGINGSSTTALVLDDVKTPVSNLLGEVGKGHKIAFNILNVGRLPTSATSSASPSPLSALSSTSWPRWRLRRGSARRRPTARSGSSRAPSTPPPRPQTPSRSCAPSRSTPSSARPSRSRSPSTAST